MRWELQVREPAAQGGFFVVHTHGPSPHIGDEEENGNERMGSEGPMALWTMGNTAALYCWIAVGSALGGVARYWCSGVAARLFGETFPWGRLFVNVTGSFLLASSPR